MSNFGAKLGVEGEKEFKQALKDIKQQYKLLTSELKLAESAFDRNENSVESLTAKNNVLEKGIKQQKETVKVLTAALENAAETFGENDRQTTNWRIALNDAQTQLNSMQREVRENNVEMKQLSKGSSEGNESLKSFAATLGKSVVAAAKMAATAILALSVAIGSFAVSAVKVGSEFDASMSQVAATMGTTVDQISELRDFALEMGETTAFSAKESAEALNYMALAGYTASESMQALPNVLNLAAAGGIDLAAASDMVTDAQSALGLSMDGTARLVDQMAMAASKSNTSVAQLGEAILAIGGTAKNMAGGTTELAAALGILADNGIKGAEGGAALRNVILSLTAPTDKAAGVLDDLGVSVFDAAGNMRPLNDTLSDLNAALSTMTQGQQTQVLNEIFNRVDLKSVNALLSNTGERFEELSGYIDSAAGAAERMAATQMDNLSGDVEAFKGAVETAQIAISDKMNPALRELVQFGTQAVSSLTKAFKQDGIAGAMDELGNVLGDGLNMVMRMLPEFLQGGAQLITALLEGILSNLPILLSGVTTLIQALLTWVVSYAPSLTDTILDLVMQLLGFISQNLPLLVQAVAGIITALAGSLGSNVGAIITLAYTIITSLVTALLDNLGPVLVVALDLLIAIQQGVQDNIDVISNTVITIITALVDFILQNLGPVMGAALELILTIGTALINYIPILLEFVIDLIMAIVNQFMETDWAAIGTNIIDGIWAGIQAGWGWLTSKVSEVANSLLAAAKSALGIASPSKEFAKIGEYMADGLSVGWSRSIDAVSNRISVDLSGAADTAKTVAGRSSRNPGTVTVNQYFYKEREQNAASISRDTRNGLRRAGWGIA